MSRRRHRTEFYGRFVAALRAVDRRGWKRLCEKLLGEHPGDLDLPEGVTLSNGYLSGVENLVSRAMRDKVASLRAQADALERAARDFDFQSEVRRFEVSQAAKRKSDDEVEALVQWLYDWTFRHNDEQEAA